MRILALTLTLLFSSLTPALPVEIPPRQGSVQDLARLLPARTAAALTELSSRLNLATHFALVILTIPALPEGVEIEEFATATYEKWGVGQKGKDDGALIVVARDNRAARIETGYGAEGYLPDAVCKSILDEVMIPAFRQGDYAGGIVAGAVEVAGRAAKEFNVNLDSLMGQRLGHHTARRSEGAPLSPLQGVLLAIALIFLFFTPFGRGLLLGMLLSNTFRGGRGGGFGGGFSSRGFGGFGGGMSGGGGASGRW